MGRVARSAIATVTLPVPIGVFGCILDDGKPDPLTGPPALGLSLSLFANLDVLPFDGASQSQIVIEARDANGQPQSNVPLSLEICSGVAVTVVSIFVTPIGSDFTGSLARSVDIRLGPSGVILPPKTLPVPAFTFSQPAEAGVSIRFDGLTSTDADGSIVSYAWNFGDGTSATGMVKNNSYSAPDSYSVTRTVTDDRGGSASTTQTIMIGGTSPTLTALIVSSPDTLAAGTTVFLDGSTSTVPVGRTITSCSWNFGDGSATATGAQVSHAYTSATKYTVVLTITDSTGATDTPTATVDQQ